MFLIKHSNNGARLRYPDFSRSSRDSCALGLLQRNQKVEHVYFVMKFRKLVALFAAEITQIEKGKERQMHLTALLLDIRRYEARRLLHRSHRTYRGYS